MITRSALYISRGRVRLVKRFKHPGVWQSVPSKRPPKGVCKSNKVFGLSPQMQKAVREYYKSMWSRGT